MATYAQSRANQVSDTGAVSVNQIFASPVTATNLLVCQATWDGLSTTCTVADDVNGGWTAIGGPTTGTGAFASYRTQAFYKSDTGSGTPRVTATFSQNATNRQITIAEYGFTGAVSVASSSYGSGSSGGGTTIVGPTVTPASGSDLVIGLARIQVSPTATTTYTFRLGNSGGGVADVLAPTGGVGYACTWTIAAGGYDAQTFAVVFSAPGGGGGGGTVTHKQSRTMAADAVIDVDSTLAYSGAVTATDLLVCLASWFDAAHTSTCTVADSVNGAWTAIGSPQTGAGGFANYRYQAFFKANTGAGTPTVTMTLNISTDGKALIIAEYDLAGAVALESSAYGNDSSADGFFNGPTRTPSLASDIVLSLGRGQVNPSAVSAGFTSRIATNTEFLGDVLAPVVQAYTPAWTAAVGNDSVLATLVFAAAAGAPSVTSYRALLGVGA